MNHPGGTAQERGNPIPSCDDLADITEVLCDPCGGLPSGGDGFRALSHSCIVTAQGRPGSPQATGERGTAQRCPDPGYRDLRGMWGGGGCGLWLPPPTQQLCRVLHTVLALSGCWVPRGLRHLCRSRLPGRSQFPASSLSASSRLFFKA